MQIIRTFHGNTVTVTPHGEIDLHTLPELLDATAGLPSRITDVTWDLSEVGFMSVRGLQLLDQQRRFCCSTHRTLRVTGLRRQPLHLLEVVNRAFPAEGWAEFVPRLAMRVA
ncbi:STAS domain-containing protein [Nocardia sp. NPDC005978]|uniref:STAS domain-containing protein n=1 Tax=unclassified Nocardia TaxID=2637762 RepID=UPI0033A4D39B